MSEVRWGHLLRVAASMGISPEAFWRLSLVEWRALTETEASGLRWSDFASFAEEYSGKKG